MYVDVEEPISFYLDLILIGVMVFVALSFGICLVSQHRNAIGRVARNARSTVFPVQSSSSASVPPNDAANGPGQQPRRPPRQHASSSGSSLGGVTPGTVKTACRHVVRGFHGMI